MDQRFQQFITAEVVPLVRAALREGAEVRATLLDTIVKIALAKGLKPGEIDGVSLRKFNRKPAALTTREASALIQELSNLTRAAS